MFHYTVDTDKSVDEAIQAIEEALKEHKFGVLWRFDLAAKLEEKGLDYDGAYRVLEVCNPVQAHRVLTHNTLVGYFLPCKIVVYEAAGHTKIGLPKPTALMDVLNNDALHDIAQEVEDTLIKAIDAAK